MKSVCRNSILFYFFLLFLGINFHLNAQENDTSTIIQTTDTTDQNADNLENLILPPLSYLLEAIENSPQIGYIKSTKTVEELNLKSIKQDWLSYLHFSGNYNYGKGTSLSSNTNGTGSVLQYSDALNSSYGIGAGLGLTVSELFEHKNKVKKQGERLKQIDYQILIAKEEQKIKIIEAYTTANQIIGTLKTKAELVVIATSMMKTIETNFTTGNADLVELNTGKTAQSAAVSDYESAKAELTRSILLLEMLTGVKIINK
ncbi:MAG: TolC family protein [Bacteroidales bacterium]|nr:TolC family protein [Bacteroidales bacterium]MDD3907853.1 TolC family protein [Bacteroidales bacterium]MDD4713305.1 TolC family protein [Bacteroidales bacterium]